MAEPHPGPDGHLSPGRNEKTPAGGRGLIQERGHGAGAQRPSALVQDSPSRADRFSVMTGVLVASSALSWMKSFHSSGTLSSRKMASTGHSGTHASQSMHS